MTVPAGQLPDGLSRRAFSAVAAWSVPVIAVAVATPLASASLDPILGLTLTGYPAFPGQELYLYGEFALGFGTPGDLVTWAATGAASGTGTAVVDAAGLFEIVLPTDSSDSPGTVTFSVTIGAQATAAAVELLDPTVLRILNSDYPVAPFYPGQPFLSLGCSLQRGGVLAEGDVVFTVMSGDVSIAPDKAVVHSTDGIINFTDVIAGGTYNSTAVVRATVPESGLFTEWPLSIFPIPGPPVVEKVTTVLPPAPVNGGWGSVSVNVKGGMWREYYTLHYAVTGPAELSMSSVNGSGASSLDNVVLANYPTGGSDNLPYLLALGTPGAVTVTAYVVGYEATTLLTWTTSVY